MKIEKLKKSEKLKKKTNWQRKKTGHIVCKSSRRGLFWGRMKINFYFDMEHLD